MQEKTKHHQGHDFELSIGLSSAAYVDRKGFVNIKYGPDGRVAVRCDEESLKNLHRLLKNRPYMRVQKSAHEFGGEPDRYIMTFQVTDWLGMTATYVM